jgi:hypothetical protein
MKSFEKMTKILILLVLHPKNLVFWILPEPELHKIPPDAGAG